MRTVLQDLQFLLGPNSLACEYYILYIYYHVIMRVLLDRSVTKPADALTVLSLVYLFACVCPRRVVNWISTRTWLT